MNLLLLDKTELDASGHATLTGRRAIHISRVLRVKEGDTVKAGVLGGRIGAARMLEVKRDEVGIRIERLDEEPPEPSPLTLIVALPRPQSFKKALHFAASSGVKSIYFIGSERVEKSYWSSSALEPDAIKGELMLGLEQGFDTIPPKVEFRRKFRDFVEGRLETAVEGRMRLLAHPYAEEECPRGVNGKVALAIGPEGGFIDSELGMFKEAGFKAVSIGCRILRVEFAIASIAGRLL